MSSHRAYINCMRCYELSSEISQYQGNDPLVQLRLKDSRHQARNEAMEIVEQNHDGDLRLYTTEVKASLDACILCDFSKPAMAIYLKKESSYLKKCFENQASQEQAHNYRTNAKSE